MKRRIFIFWAFINLICSTSFGNGYLNRHTLLSLNENEIIYYNEYSSSFSAPEANQFSCILVDTIYNTKTLVWNGERVISADYIYVYNNNIDLYDFSKCSFEFKEGNDSYLYIDGTLYGPYENVWYDCNELKHRYNETNHQYFNRNKFYFRQMGTDFVHYNDSVIMPLNEIRYEYTSPNGLHTIRFADDWSYIYLDNTVMEMPKSEYIVQNIYDVCMMDNGICLVDIAYQNHRTTEFLITKYGCREIEQGEYFDFDTEDILPITTADSICDYFEWDLNISMQDDARKHYFMSKWGYDYVTIDGERYGQGAPIKAVYNSELNAFQWVCIEYQELILYTFYLN